MTEWFILEKPEKFVPVFISRPEDVAHMMDVLPDPLIQAAQNREFAGEEGELVQLYSADGRLIGVLAGAGPKQGDYHGALNAGQIARRLPAGEYMIALRPDDWDWTLIGVSWGLGLYKFTRYLKEEPQLARLVLTEIYKPDEVRYTVRAVNRGRDMINTPAQDMGPVELHDVAKEVAARYGAKIEAIIGEELIEQNYPMIHAVGRAGPQPPRLVELHWGDENHPRLAICGKGITFDTGGLNMKSASGARLMKKDMGGAAHAVALAEMIMAAKLPVRLHVLLAIAENSVSSNAFHPGDVLSSRTGLTVEIDNTDAEGRLVLGDALCKATEFVPAQIIDFATLTGAARVALGPTLPPFFCNRDERIIEVLGIADTLRDPVWNMPLWQPYNKMLGSPIADMKNAGGSFAGCVTAALFLERFVKNMPWMHFDVYGWSPSRTKIGQAGGEIYAVRALFEWVRQGGVRPDPDPEMPKPVF